MSGEIRVTVEDLTTGKKYGAVGRVDSAASWWGRVVESTVLLIQGSSFLEPPALQKLDED